MPTQADKAKLIEHKRHNLVAFTNAKELDTPPRFFFGNCAGERDYLPLLYRCWFKADDIAIFEPGERFITGKKLLERWAERCDIPADDRIRIATSESRLMSLHPTLGLTQATFSDDADYATLEDGLFQLPRLAEAWHAYVTERCTAKIDGKPVWGDRHKAHHAYFVQAGGVKRKRGTRPGESKKTRPGVLVPLMTMRLADLDAKTIAAWLDKEAKQAPTTAAHSLACPRYPCMVCAVPLAHWPNGWKSPPVSWRR